MMLCPEALFVLAEHWRAVYCAACDTMLNGPTKHEARVEKAAEIATRSLRDVVAALREEVDDE